MYGYIYLGNNKIQTNVTFGISRATKKYAKSGMWLKLGRIVWSKQREANTAKGL